MKKIYYGFIILFFVICSAPFWSMSFYKGNTESNENRNMAAFPEFSLRHIKSFINGVNGYVFDHHAFRPELSKAYMSFMLHVMNESPMPQNVVLGKDGWYFLGNYYSDIFNESLGIVSLDLAAIDKSCVNIYQMKQFCDSLGIGFYFAIAPNKEIMYSEYLPLEGNNRPGFKKLMTDRLKEKYNIDVIDMGDYIYPIKDSVQMYLKTDSHWNNYGGFLAAKKLTDVIGKDYNLNIISADDYTITPTQLSRIGDLTGMLKIHLSDNDFAIQPKIPYRIEKTEIAATAESPNITYTKNEADPDAPNALVFRDSFFTAVVLPFSSSLYQSTYIWSSHFDGEMIIREIEKTQIKPDFILFEVVERHLPVFSVQ